MVGTAGNRKLTNISGNQEITTRQFVFCFGGILHVPLPNEVFARPQATCHFRLGVQKRKMTFVNHSEDTTQIEKDVQNQRYS